jgi:3-hydroxybutyryl-CoA dehydrogenase
MRTGEPIAVVGAGLMGHGIAQVFACAGHPVAITDADPTVLGSVPDRVGANLELMGQDIAAAAAIDLRPDLESAVREAAFVFEAVAENVAVKREVFASASRVVSDDTVLATNTSVISVGEIALDARDPSRVVGTHWWNPPYLVPLVEVVQAESTRSDVVERTIGLLEAVGKAPVHIRRDVPGFVGNRLQHALWREAFALIEDGVCDAETVDHVVRNSFGLRMPAIGPIESADLVGLDLTLAIHEYLLPHLNRTPGPAAVLREHVERGELGMKVGRGFRAWTADEAQAVRERLLDHLVETTRIRLESARRKERALR